MESLLLVAIAIIGFIVWTVLSFVRYKKQESEDKTRISSCLASGANLLRAIETVFTELNTSLPKKLSNSTVSTVAKNISSLEDKMDIENVIEIYSTFVHRYICRNSTRPSPNVTDDTVLYAVQNMVFNQKNGYFVLKPDSDEEINKKYPKLALYIILGGLLKL